MDNTQGSDKSSEMNKSEEGKQAGGCGCGHEHKQGEMPHSGTEGPNLTESDETKNKTQDEGKTYDT